MQAHPRIRPAVVLPLLLLVLLPLACDDDGTGAATPPPVQEVHLTAANTFEPASVTVERGTVVRFINDIQRVHTVTPATPGQAGAWPEATLSDAGQVFQHTFEAAGSFSYYCRPHQGRGMAATIVVR